MPQLVFKAQYERYASQPNYGKEQALSFCKAMQIDFQDDGENHYGYYKASYKGHRVDIKVCRDEACLEVHLDNFFSATRKRIKELSAKQVENLKKKWDVIIEERHRTDAKLVKRAEIYERISNKDKKIKLLDGKYMNYGDYQFKFYENDNKILCVTAWVSSYKYLYYGDSLDDFLAEMKKSFEEYTKEVGNILAILEENKELIKEYYSLEN